MALKLLWIQVRCEKQQQFPLLSTGEVRLETENRKNLLFNSWYLHRVEEVGSALAALERLGDREEKYKLETDCKPNSDMSQMQLSKITMKQMCMPSEMIINKKDKRHTDLGDKIVMIGQMGATVHTAVTAVAGVQIRLERLGFCQLHHVWAGPKTQRETRFFYYCLYDGLAILAHSSSIWLTINRMISFSFELTVAPSQDYKASP